MNQEEYEREVIEKPFFKSITFKKTNNGKVALVDQFDNFTNKVHPISSIPENLLNALENRLNKNEKNLFQNIISSKECSDKTKSAPIKLLKIKH